jgi:GT2 family glycosyltransferase
MSDELSRSTPPSWDGRIREADEVASLRRALRTARENERMLEQKSAQLEAELQAIYQSTVWRWSGPARRVVNWLKRSGYFRFLNRRRAKNFAPVEAPTTATAKAALRVGAAAELAAFLDTDERLALPASTAPDVSILLVLFNQAPLTFACLQSIADTVDLATEVIIIDNASTDETTALLERLDGARIVRNAENRHFLAAVNQGAALARGKTLLLLNNDACLRLGSLRAAFDTLCSDPSNGAVGGPIILPDGRLQEAGSIIWRDGSCLGYGRGADPAAPEFQFQREVDYCSGAFLLVRHSVFAELDGFDPVFAPAYYEETDFCMRLRAAGYRVIYEPNAVVDHYEFGSAVKLEAALELQRAHQELFVTRHREALQSGHWPADASPLVARARGADRRVLVIDDRVPYPSLGAGYPRAAEILRTLAADGWFVTFYPVLFPHDNNAAIHTAFPRGIEFMLGLGQNGLRPFLAERQNYYDSIMISRPHNMRDFLASAPNKIVTRIIYDAEAIFAPREWRRREIVGRPLSRSRREAMLRTEMDLARTAQTVIAVSQSDARAFRKAGCADVRVLGHALRVEPTVSGFGERRDFLFVGALDSDLSPNADSIVWFARTVMPLLDNLIGDRYGLLVAGRCTAPRVLALSDPRIRVLQRIDDLSALYECARVFVAPTRYAAGIPHKVHEAAAKGVPVVTTPLLAEQLGWTHDAEILVGATPSALAEACARLYQSETVWQRLRQAALERVKRDCDPDAFVEEVRMIMSGPPVGRRRCGALFEQAHDHSSSVG